MEFPFETATVSSGSRQLAVRRGLLIVVGLWASETDLAVYFLSGSHWVAVEFVLGLLVIGALELGMSGRDQELGLHYLNGSIRNY